MPAVDSDIKYRAGGDGAPSNDADPYGGAITSTDLDQMSPGNLIQPVPRATGSNADYYGAAYRRNAHASSDWTEAAFVIRNGAILNSGAGEVSVRSTSAADTGDLYVVGKEGGVWTNETVAVTGTTTAFGLVVWDVASAWRYQYLVGGAPAEPTGMLTIAVDGEVVAVIHGTATGYPNKMATAEVEIAVADAVDQTVGGTDRTQAPADVSAFARAVRWSGEGAVDNSIPVPGDELQHGHYIGFALHFIAVADIEAPVGGYLQVDINLPGVGT